jgi:hypothetical protein
MILIRAPSASKSHVWLTHLARLYSLISDASEARATALVDNNRRLEMQYTVSANGQSKVASTFAEAKLLAKRANSNGHTVTVKAVNPRPVKDEAPVEVKEEGK